MENNPTSAFFDKLAEIIDNKELIKLVLSNQKNKSSDLTGIIVTLAQLKRGYRLSFVYRHATKDITKNYEFAEGLELLKKALAAEFNDAHLFSNRENA